MARPGEGKGGTKQNRKFPSLDIKDELVQQAKTEDSKREKSKRKDEMTLL